MSTRRIFGSTCHIQLYPWLQPYDGYLWQAGWLEGATSVLLNHHEGRLSTWPWDCTAQCPNWQHLQQLVLGSLPWFGQYLAQCPTCLPIRHSYRALSFKDSEFAIALPWRAANIWACLVSLSLPFLGLGLPLMFCYKRYWWPSGQSCLKWQQGSPAVAVETLSLYLMHIRTGICPLKSPVSYKSISPDW